MFIKRPITKLALLKGVSMVCLNLSAGWYGAAVIVPSFSGVTETFDIVVLTYDVVFGTIFLILGVWIDSQRDSWKK